MRPSTVSRNRALCYNRKSQVRNIDDTDSLAGYEAIVERECRERGYTIEWYRDVEGHRSGRHTKSRTDYRRMLGHIGDPDVVAVFAAIQDRVSRCVLDTAELMERCQKYGVHFVFPQSGVDTSRTGWTATAVAQINMQAVFAQYYSDDVRDKMLLKINDYRNDGIVWSKPPFGAVRHGTGRRATFVASRDLAAMVACLEIYAEGKSYTETSEILEIRGYRHRGRNGLEKPFTTEAVRTIVGNTLFFCGYVVRGKWSAKKERVKLEGEGGFIERYARAINAVLSPHIEVRIDPMLAERVIERRFRAQLAGRPPLGWLPLLTPIAWYNGKRLRADSKSSGKWYRTQRAGLWVDAEKVDGMFIDHLSGLQFPPELMDCIRAELNRRSDDGRLKKIEIDLGETRTRLNTLQEMRLDGSIERDAYNEKYAALNSKIRILEAELNMPTQVDMLMRGLGDLGGTIKTMTKARQKQAVHDLFDRIEFNDEGEISAVHPAAWSEAAFSSLKDAYENLGANDALNGCSLQSWTDLSIDGNCNPSDKAEFYLILIM